MSMQRHDADQQLPYAETAASVKSRQVLHALTSAALVLPGLLLSPGQAAAKDRINFQYSRYEEGERNLYGAPNSLKPISADVLHGGGMFSLTDRSKFSFGYTQDTWSGATPVSTTPLAATGGNRLRTINGEVVGASPILSNSTVLLDKDLNPIGRDPLTQQSSGIVDTRSVMVMASASPETRRQASFGLSHEWNEAAVNVAGGFSRERDYKSSFGTIGGRLDFNQKLTSVKFGGGYTHSEIGAILDQDSFPYITNTAYSQQIVTRGNSKILQGNRQDWSTNVGLTQVLTKNALIDASIGYTHSNGFLENPYKATSVIFYEPARISNNLIEGDVKALIEQRPNIRNQVALNAKYIQYINPLNAALHMGYKLSVDDWGVNTHTFDASWVQPIGSGWTLTPRIRYYSQDAASFYRPYLFSQQAFTRQQEDSLGRKVWFDDTNSSQRYFGPSQFDLVDQNGNPVDGFSVNAIPQMIAFDAGKLPENFSSDHRLAGFGALSGGVILSKILGKGVALETGFEYYTRASSMQIGGGNNSFADFDYYVANAAIKFDIEPTTNSLPMGSSGGSAASHHAHASAHHHHKIPPAGIMFGHMLDKPGDFMAGYRFMYNWTGGSMLHGTHKASDQTIIDQGCSADCQFTPKYMDMRMHMIDLMYAPTKWLNVMLMPTFMDMDMNLRELSGNKDPITSGAHTHHGAAGHETGAISDTYFSSLVKLIDIPGHRLHANLGFSAPTGKVDIELRRSHQADGGLIHFGMQLGSGTWDFMPSLTYSGERSRWSWGTQLSGTKRMETENKSGYRLGDIFQATTWGAYDLGHWLTASIRGVYTHQGAVHGDFNVFNARIGPMDFPANYGGQFWDIGLGGSAIIPSGRFAGNRFGFEWLEPISSDFNGFQLDRKGALAATWSYHF